MNYKIVIENYKTISNLELDLAPGVEGFVGDNAQGKTNILNAIQELVSGKNDPSKIRDGEEKYVVRLDIYDEDDKPISQIRRTQTKSGSKLDGKGLPMGQTPATYIAKLFDDRMLNPFRLITEDPVQFLKENLPVELKKGDIPEWVDLPEEVKHMKPFRALDQATKYVGVLRREKGKELKTIQGVVEDMESTLPPKPSGDPKEADRLKEQIEKLEKLQTRSDVQNDRIKQMVQDKTEAAKHLRETTERLKGLKEKFEKIKEAMLKCQGDVDRYQEEVDKNDQAIETLRGETKDYKAEIQAKKAELDRFGDMEKAKTAHENLQKRKQELESVQNEHSKLDEEYKRLAYELPKELIQRAKIPVEGIEFNGEELLVNGRRVDLLSHTERAIVATRLAAAIAKQRGNLAISLDGIEIMDEEHRNEWIKEAENCGLKVFYTRMGKPEGSHERQVKGGEVH